MAAAAPSSLGATLLQGVLPLVPIIPAEDYEFVTLKSYVTVGGEQEKRQAEVPKLNQADPELILRTVVEFFDACNGTRLSLTTGPKRKTKFRECVHDALRQTWDTIQGNHPDTVPGFQEAIEDFIGHYFLPTATADQNRYLDTCTKPYRFNCDQLGERLRYMNLLIRWLPGNNGNVPYDELGLKHKYYNMMLQQWKHAFLSSGLDISNPNYSFLDLQRYMSIQEAAFNAGDLQNKRPRNEYNMTSRTRQRTTAWQARGYPPTRGSYSGGRFYRTGRSQYRGGSYPTRGPYRGGRGYYTQGRSSGGRGFSSSYYSSPPSQASHRGGHRGGRTGGRGSYGARSQGGRNGNYHSGRGRSYAAGRGGGYNQTYHQESFHADEQHHEEYPADEVYYEETEWHDPSQQEQPTGPPEQPPTEDQHWMDNFHF